MFNYVYFSDLLPLEAMLRQASAKDKPLLIKCYDNWQDKTERRLSVFYSAQWSAHHLSYANRGAERFEDLTLLCNTCHAKVHEL
jgi:HNH endonuclease